MADIMIKGMEMPRDGVYWCEIGIAGDIAIITIHGEDRKSFPLVQLPERNGRLNDADALERKSILVEKPTGTIRTAYDPNGDPCLFEATGTEAKRFVDILKADDEGRLVLSPCKVGDTVYVLVKEGKIKKYIVSEIIKDHNNLWIDRREIDNPYHGGLLNALQFGVDVFLAREDAEKALEGMNNDKR